MEIKTITCRTAIEAEGLRARLIEAGIPSVAYDETNSKVARGILDNSMEVMVREDEYERAKAVYGEMLAEQQRVAPWCPQCGSENVESITGNRLRKGRFSIWLASLTFLFPMSGSLVGKRYRCLDCGREFEHQ